MHAGSNFLNQNNGAVVDFDFQRHYRNVFKEAKKLSEFQIYEPADDKVRKGKSVLSEAISRAEYMARLNVLLANFVNKEAAMLNSMSSQIRTLVPAVESMAIVDNLKSFVKTVLVSNTAVSASKKGIFKKNRPSSSASLHAPLSDEDAGAKVNAMFSSMESVFNGATVETPLSNAQSTAIEKLLGGQDLDEGDAEDIHCRAPVRVFHTYIPESQPARHNIPVSARNSGDHTSNVMTPSKSPQTARATAAPGTNVNSAVNTSQAPAMVSTPTRAPSQSKLATPSPKAKSSSPAAKKISSGWEPVSFYADVAQANEPDDEIMRSFSVNPKCMSPIGAKTHKKEELPGTSHGTVKGTRRYVL